MILVDEQKEQLWVNAKKDVGQLYEKVKQYPLISLLFIIAAFSLFWFPHWQVSQFGINNATEIATLENQYRVTLAQILGGVAIGISLYYAWQRNNIVQDGQITDRFTRAVDQLGNRKIEIRLGGIYALERIANKSDEDYWQIMEILTAYVRKNSSIDNHSKDNSRRNVSISMDIQANESTKNEVPKIRTISLDIQAILTVIVRRKYSYEHGETNSLNIQGTNLQQTDLSGANLSLANFSGANLSGAQLYAANLSLADFSGANLSLANFTGANLLGANLSLTNLSWAGFSDANLSMSLLIEADLPWVSFKRANLGNADLSRANLSGDDLSEANLSEVVFEMANLSLTNLTGADLKGANLTGAQLYEANLKGAKNLTIDQLSKVNTLYNATLDNDLIIQIKDKCPTLFEKPNDTIFSKIIKEAHLDETYDCFQGIVANLL